MTQFPDISPDQTFWATQFTQHCQTKQEAQLVHDALDGLDGCFHTRLVAPTPEKPGWRVHAYFADNAPDCDGCLRVIVPPGVAKLWRMERAYDVECRCKGPEHLPDCVMHT